MIRPKIPSWYIAIDYTRVGYLRAAPLQTVRASFQAYGFPIHSLFLGSSKYRYLVDRIIRDSDVFFL
ncbi:hypothetical protein [Mulberry dwarf phytoplasma]|uniref:hypothetical protein n=2 Tax=Mulberry dwarf phytoplasma TaxID=186171 RepID=UPI001D11B177|nr:hypothetical protein [Mulberry dwarf phytoplasma]